MSKFIAEISSYISPRIQLLFLRGNKTFLRLSTNFHVVALLIHFCPPPFKGQLAQNRLLHTNVS